MPNFKLERTKFWKSKKLALLLLLCVVIPSAIFYWNYSNLDKYGQDLFHEIQLIELDIRIARLDYTKKMEEAGLTPEEKESHMTLFTAMENEMLELMKLKDYEARYEIPEQIVTFYEAYKDYAEDRLANAQEQLIVVHDFERIESEIAFFQGLVDQGLPYEDPTRSIYGWNFVKSVVEVTFGMALALLILLLVANIFSEEKTNNTEKIRLVQPVKRVNILFAKMLASLVYILLFVILTVVVSYFLAGLLGSGFGTIHYPIELPYSFVSSGISVGEYIAQASLYFCLFLLVIFSVTALFATIIKDTAIVTVLAMFTVFFSNGTNPSYLNPFSYLSFDYLIMTTQDHPLILTGIALAFSVLMTLFAYYLSTNTWVQNFTLTPKEKNSSKALLKHEEKTTLPLPYFRFEMLKIIKKRTTIIPFLILLVLVTSSGLSQYQQYERNRDYRITDHHAWAEFIMSGIIKTEQRLANEDLESSQVAGIKELITRQTRWHNVYVNAVEAYKSGDAERIIEAQKEDFQYWEQWQHTGLVEEAVKVFYATQDEIIERQVQPVISNETLIQALITPFARDYDLKEVRDYHEFKISQPSTTYIFNSLFKDGLGILALAVFAISLALGFSDETHDTRTIYLLNTQPLHGKRIYFGKLLAQSVVFISMALIMAAVLFLGLKISGSPTESNFPAVQYLNEIDKDYSGSYLLRENLTENRGRELPDSASTYVGFTFRDMIYENAEMAAMFILSGLGIVAFAMLASLKIRHKIGVSLGTVLVFGLGFLVSRYALKGTSIFFPFIWLDTPLVATGEASMIFDKTNMTGLCGILVLILWLIAFVVLGYKVFSKRGRYQ